MEPLLHNRKSTVVIEKSDVPLKKYDVALYRRPTGEYVLHRVIKVLKNSYLISGDNRIWKEKVPDHWILGRMTGYYEDETDHYVSCESRDYHSYLRRLKWHRRKSWVRRQIGRIIKSPKKLADIKNKIIDRQ